MNSSLVLGAVAGLTLVLGGCQTPVRAAKPSSFAGAAWVLSPVSGLPLPGKGGRPVPSRTGAPNLRVLDWAGYPGAVSFTFDDTQPSQMQHWPEIKATGVRSTWYLSQTYGSGPAFEAVWKDAVASGHEIGNHTLSHLAIRNKAAADDLVRRALGTTLAAAAAQELTACDDYIKGVLGQGGVWTMAYPYGDTGWKPYVQAYLFARTVNNGLVPPTGAAAEARSWQTLLFHSLTPTTAEWYAGVAAADVVASLEYGKALGSVWLDSVVNVGGYWTAARWLRASNPTTKSGEWAWKWTVPPSFPPGKFLRVTVTGGSLSQRGVPLAWNDHGFYEVSIDAGPLVWRP